MTIYEFKSPVSPSPEIGIVISPEALRTVIGKEASVMGPDGGMQGKIIDVWIEGDWIHYKVEVPGDLFPEDMTDISLNKD